MHIEMMGGGGGSSSRDFGAFGARENEAEDVSNESYDRDSLRDGGEAGEGSDPGGSRMTAVHSDTFKFDATNEEKDKMDDDLMGDMGLADFMLLAYTISNVYQRHKMRTKKNKLDDSEVTGHDETLLFIVVSVYAVAVLAMALTLMGGGIMCRPTTVSLGAFATGSGGVTPGGYFQYGMDLVNRVCETDIKFRGNQFWPVFTMLTFVLLFIGAGVNATYIKVGKRERSSRA